MAVRGGDFSHVDALVRAGNLDSALLALQRWSAAASKSAFERRLRAVHQVITDATDAAAPTSGGADGGESPVGSAAPPPSSPGREGGGESAQLVHKQQ